MQDQTSGFGTALTSMARTSPCSATSSLCALGPDPLLPCNECSTPLALGWPLCMCATRACVCLLQELHQCHEDWLFHGGEDVTTTSSSQLYIWVGPANQVLQGSG